MHPGIHNFKLGDRVLMLDEDIMTSLDLNESWLTCVVLINGHDHLNKEKKGSMQTKYLYVLIHI